MAVGKASAHLCLTIIIKELKINVEQGRVINNIIYYQTINIYFYYSFFVEKTYCPLYKSVFYRVGRFYLVATK